MLSENFRSPDRDEESSVKRNCLLVALAMVLAGCVLARGSVAIGPPDEPASRMLEGRVLDKSENPVAEAVVYLKNRKNMAVKTYISEKDGAYHFNALSPNVDYDVYAEYQGHKSDSKTLSSFDSRKTAIINLKIK